MSEIDSVFFVFTNYNNALYTKAAVESIANNRGSVKTKIIIIDNMSSMHDKEILGALEKVFTNVMVIYNEENLGYFAGLNIGLCKLENQRSDNSCVIIGNNDLIFPPDFFERLEKCWDDIKDHPVVSPDLVSLDGVHQNPHVIKKIGPLREMIWDFYFFNYYISVIIIKLAQILKPIFGRKDNLQYRTRGEIYQGYGACYILGPKFFEAFKQLWAPTFLMGEEFFLTMQLYKKGLSVFYEPCLQIEHHDHATCNRVPGYKMWQISRESHKVYRKYIRGPFFKMDPTECPFE